MGWIEKMSNKDVITGTIIEIDSARYDITSILIWRSINKHIRQDLSNLILRKIIRHFPCKFGEKVTNEDKIDKCLNFEMENFYSPILKITRLLVTA